MAADISQENSGPIEESSGQPLPSRTSILVAAARAFGSREPDATVRNPDMLADLLIGPEELALISEHPISRINDLDYSDASEVVAIVVITFYLLLRTRFIDEAMEKAVRAGATQVVVLGAGFDSRAYRFAKLLKDCRVIEVDAAPTQKYKLRRLEAALIDIPSNVAYARIDFARDDLRQVLRSAGLRPDEKTFYIWEGVCMYLPESSVRATLRAIVRASAPGSSLVLDYSNRQWLDALRGQPPGPLALPSTWAEPWLFGVPDSGGREFFRELGFETGVAFATTDPELCKRYAMRANGSMYGAPVFQRMRADAVARVAAGESLPPAMAALWIAELVVPAYA